jgi:DNA-directed RNA polymerase specialized sigma24 family protein
MSRDWSLTQEAWNKLLAAFSEDPDEAARQYEVLRIKLIKYFDWRRIPLSEDRADEVFNRVARRIDEGQKIDNVAAYAFRVAYLVYLEAIKEPQHEELDPEKALSEDKQFVDDERERRRSCFDLCLGHLPIEKRDLLLAFHQEERRAKIENRKTLADQLEITINALRIKVHRIRKELETCIWSCLRPPDATRNVTR